MIGAVNSLSQALLASKETAQLSAERPRPLSVN